eukprot:1159864-Pelagomonas_calceolata.AAC.23
MPIYVNCRKGGALAQKNHESPSPQTLKIAKLRMLLTLIIFMRSRHVTHGETIRTSSPCGLLLTLKVKAQTLKWVMLCTMILGESVNKNY